MINIYISFIFFVFFVCFCTSDDLCFTQPPPEAEDRRLPANRNQTLKIATFNVAWLFDGVDDPDVIPYGSATLHQQKVAEQIVGLDADIIALQEIENCAALNQLLSFVGDSTYRAYFVRGTDSATGQNVAILSRFDPVEFQRTNSRSVTPVAGSTCSVGPADDTAISKNLYARFETSSAVLHMFTVHFKAGGSDSSCRQREGQAAVLRKFIEQKAASSSQDVFIVLGDFNDFDPSIPDSNGKTSTGSTLEIIKGQTYPRLVNVASTIAQKDRFTTVGRGFYDHVLLDEATFDDRHVSSTIDHTLVDNPVENSYSDHFAVATTLLCGGERAVDSSSTMILPFFYYLLYFIKMWL